MLEILPGEMGNILLPKIPGMDPDIREDLLCRIDATVRQDVDIEQALDIVEEELLVNMFGIDAGLRNQCRMIC